MVDSDDWLDEASLRVFLRTLKAHLEEGRAADLYVTDFVYDKVCEGTSFRRSFRRNFPDKEMFGWEEVGTFRFSSLLMMHSLVYRTSVLRQCRLSLPEHTFYVDNIYLYKPLPFTKKLCYLELPLYHYLIGREDQSVSHSNITKRYRQQIRVMKEMIVSYSYEEIAARHEKEKGSLANAARSVPFVVLARTVCAARFREKACGAAAERVFSRRCRDAKMSAASIKGAFGIYCLYGVQAGDRGGAGRGARHPLHRRGRAGRVL